MKKSRSISRKNHGFIHKVHGLIGGKKKWGLLLVAVLLVVTAGYTGLTYWQRHKLTAHAAGWTYLGWNTTNPQYPNPGVGWMRACKTYVGAYGGVYNVTFQVYRTNNRVFNIIAYDMRKGVPIDPNGVRNNNWLYGVVAGLSINTSAYNGDRVQLDAQTSEGTLLAYNGFSGNNNISPSTLATC